MARRGYVLAVHGGGCVGVLHSLLYPELEMAYLLEQTILQPHGRPRRDRDDCIKDAVVACNSPGMRKRSAQWHLDNMLPGALYGADDHLGRGGAALLWVSADMARKRAAGVANVDTKWTAASWRVGREGQED